MMICGSCGASNEDGAVFCAECGAPLSPQAEPPVPSSGESVPEAQPKTSEPGHQQSPGAIPPRPAKPLPPRRSAGFRGIQKPERKLPMPLLVVGAVVLVALVITIIVLATGRSADNAAIQAVQAVFKPDTERVFTVLTPKKVLNEFLDRLDYDRVDLSEQCADMDDSISDLKESLSEELDARLRFSYKVRREKDYSNRDLRALRQDYLDNYGVRIRDAKYVTVRVTVKAGREQEHFDVENITVVKVGRKWYVDLPSFAGSITGIQRDLSNLFW
ncbi:MAG: zinc ribbon domain-containing protein [Oscillospiraceae bacterium]|nr:zinc ribbon domain-containing protein [Oscillospiraceae bacterium]